MERLVYAVELLPIYGLPIILALKKPYLKVWTKFAQGIALKYAQRRPNCSSARVLFQECNNQRQNLLGRPLFYGSCYRFLLKHQSWSPRQLEQELSFSVTLLQSQLPHEGLVVDLQGANCSPELHYHDKSHYYIILRNIQTNFDLLALSTHPVLLFCLNCLLNPLGGFPVFYCSFCFIPLLLQISPLTTEVEKPQKSRKSLVTYGFFRRC